MQQSVATVSGNSQCNGQWEWNSQCSSQRSSQWQQPVQQSVQQSVATISGNSRCNSQCNGQCNSPCNNPCNNSCNSQYHSQWQQPVQQSVQQSVATIGRWPQKLLVCGRAHMRIIMCDDTASSTMEWMAGIGFWLPFCVRVIDNNRRPATPSNSESVRQRPVSSPTDVWRSLTIAKLQTLRQRVADGRWLSMPSSNVGRKARKGE